MCRKIGFKAQNDLLKLMDYSTRSLKAPTTFTLVFYCVSFPIIEEAKCMVVFAQKNSVFN